MNYGMAKFNVNVTVAAGEGRYMSPEQFSAMMDKATDMLYYFLEGYMYDFNEGAAMVDYDGAKYNFPEYYGKEE